MKPRILLVEDDPTSRAVLLAATESLPAEVDVAASVAEAMALATRHRHALWLFDARLPDGSGSALLARLREAGLATPALAHTASRERREHEALRAAGFVATVAKPLPAERWQATLREVLAGASGSEDATPARAAPTIDLATTPVWDDAAALAALGGKADNVAALRRLFLDELPGVRDAVACAVSVGDADALRAALHRLRASCGFVGAARLDAAASLLRHTPVPDAALRSFLAAAQDTQSSS